MDLSRARLRLTPGNASQTFDFIQLVSTLPAYLYHHRFHCGLQEYLYRGRSASYCSSGTSRASWQRAY